MVRNCSNVSVSVWVVHLYRRGEYHATLPDALGRHDAVALVEAHNRLAPATGISAVATHIVEWVPRAAWVKR
jgi:hypothetical protein